MDTRAYFEDLKGRPYHIHNLEEAFQVFRQDVLRTWPLCKRSTEHAKLGIISELGEIADLWKKEIQKGKEVTSTAYLDEVGDVIFYICAMNHAKEGYTNEHLKADLGQLFGGMQGPRVGMSLNDVSTCARYANRNLIDSWQYSLMAAMALNVDKRAKRFPAGFTPNERKHDSLRHDRLQELQQVYAAVASQLEALIGGRFQEGDISKLETGAWSKAGIMPGECIMNTELEIGGDGFYVNITIPTGGKLGQRYHAGRIEGQQDVARLLRELQEDPFMPDMEIKEQH